tara:strand:- start:1726 stop:2211 length:486 start_codon:yes stop_codon:yes gene_type:complete
MSFYRSSQAIIDDMNYYSDPRTRAAREGSWYDSFDERAMTATKELTHWDNEDVEHTEVFTFNVRFEVCDLCNGKGSHVNPSIDSGGLSYDDFYGDPSFEEDYHSGRYDVSCNQCSGKRVVPVIDDHCLSDDQKRALKIMREQAEEEAAYQAEVMAEMRMGC